MNTEMKNKLLRHFSKESLERADTSLRKSQQRRFRLQRLDTKSKQRIKLKNDVSGNYLYMEILSKHFSNTGRKQSAGIVRKIAHGRNKNESEKGG